MLGVKKGQVILTDHSNNWKRLFQKEKQLLINIIGESIEDIEHFGSTSIEGIKAKPVLDILVGVNRMEDFNKFDRSLMKAEGYYHLPGVKLQGKQVFAKFSDLETLTKTHILHVVEFKGKWWNEHLTFRHYLNSHPLAAKEYEELKNKLASQYPADESAYTEGKYQFVQDIVKRANDEGVQKQNESLF
ncbi:GrpB family protein [Rossellomorea vietnamensis]|uniref:GrpB family protein n=1 Tax=Rossellomorea vietnamensis TaxID=218284 RepID=A0A5D4KAX1_9BACI|nr:GrpB family protein [Rossellomorea vietnamensis]